MNDRNNVDSTKDGSNHKRKRIVLIRHGCTFMNEYLAEPGCGWGDADFSDIFDEKEGEMTKYRDSPLSARGVNQARSLANKWSFRRKDDLNKNIINELDLVVVSPLTRALQTTELGLLPCWNDDKNRPPIVALPYAAERLYLISDVGMPTQKLSKNFPWVDFESGYSKPINKDRWWFSPYPITSKTSGSEDEGTLQYEIIDLSTNERNSKKYKEWRPMSKRQQYAHPGEPEDYFSNRMNNLIHWLDCRDESTIALVCHWGVIDWLIGQDFDNCQVKVVDFEEDIKNRNMIRAKM